MPAPVLMSFIPVRALIIVDFPALNCPAKTRRNFPSALYLRVSPVPAFSAERSALSRRSAILLA